MVNSVDVVLVVGCVDGVFMVGCEDAVSVMESEGGKLAKMDELCIGTSGLLKRSSFVVDFLSFL